MPKGEALLRLRCRGDPANGDLDNVRIKVAWACLNSVHANYGGVLTMASPAQNHQKRPR
jgi:hypothetical protein